MKDKWCPQWLDSPLLLSNDNIFGEIFFFQSTLRRITTKSQFVLVVEMNAKLILFVLIPIVSGDGNVTRTYRGKYAYLKYYDDLQSRHGINYLEN